MTEIKTLKDSFEIPAIEKDYDRPAYIIFTSGTTGEPKGVIITHRAAMNTICNINQKYNITERDVFFGLANLSFDLSVYDIFGCYQVGGTLVLPDSSSIKDPKQLTELLVVHGVTVWNSVPAQMQMVINYMENSKVNSDIELRVVLLSGDWIPVNLPKKIYEKFNKSRVVSLGGATEASIWSIYYDIQREDDFEKSIPYGYPLANQKFYVLNENLQSCPDYVVGSLYIAGVGLSAGYLNDEKLNQEKYKYLPETGEKIYKTGDIGCYTRDGIILFKGREAGDEQVKIHGHRVELAEIRSVLNEHPLVESSVVLAMGESAEDLHINAVVAPVKKKELTSIHITNAEKENLEKLEKYYEEEIDQDLFERWINKSEEVVTSDIFNTFRCYSIFDKNDTVYSFDEIVQKMQIPEKLHKLTKRWLRVLIKEKVIEEKEGGYQLIQQEKDFDSFKLWDEFYQIENKFGYSRELVDYLKQSSDLLPELIQGKEDPLNILFPKGEMDPALAAYHDNQINKMLNADYISMETSQTFRLLGEKYGKILNKLGYSNYILIGHCVGGLIALETAQYLQKKNVQVSDVTLISSNIPKQKNQTILSQATDEIYRKTLQSSLDNEILLERIFAKLIGADAYKAGYQVDEERLQQYIEYIVDQGTGDITVEALCNTGGKFEDVAEEFRLLASKSVSERLNALYNIIERPNGELMEHQLKMLNILFRVFSQNFRCVSTYEPKPYYGNMRILCCEIQGGHFYPGFFAEDYETWKPYAKGKLTFELIKGWHLDCITEPNLGENIKKMLDFNY